ncbi:hypothetical protein BJX65DRAFT_302009 [Aspergillus insuetus]
MAKKSKKSSMRAKAPVSAEKEAFPAPEPEATEEPVEVESDEEVMIEEPEAPAPEDLLEVNIEYNQPIASPYEHPIATVHIGSKRYGIPVYYLERIPYFKRQTDVNYGREVVLEDVDEDIGHTLIHFLYTGRYETLYSGYSVATEYRRSALAYQAARRYKLFGLEAVARKQIEHFSPHVHLQTVLETAREVFPDLPSDEAWFKIYLNEYFSTSFDDSRDFFHREEFIKAIGHNTAFDRMIMQLTIDVLFARISELEATVNEHPPATEPEPEPELDAVPLSEPLSESESLPEPAPESESGLGPEPESANQFKGAPEAVIDLSAIPPADAEETPIPGPDIFGGPECPAEAPLSGGHPPTQRSAHADYSVRVHDDTVGSPRATSLIEIGPATEPALEPAEPEPSDAWWGLQSEKDRKNKSAASFSVEKVARPPPIARLL